MNKKKKRYNENMHLKMMEAMNIRVLINHDISRENRVDQ